MPIVISQAIRRIGLFVLLAVLYTLTLRSLGAHLADDWTFRWRTLTSAADVRAMSVVPAAVGGAVLLAVVAGLRWWRPVFVDDRPVRRWTVAVPAVMVAAAALGTDYGALAGRGAGMSLLVLLAALLGAFSMVTLFLGIGVTVLRRCGPGERGVALGASLLFGLSGFHIPRTAAGAQLQVVTVVVYALIGYLLYLTRRRTGGLAVPVAVLAAWTFAGHSNGLTADGASLLGAIMGPAFVPAYLILAILLLGRRDEIELPADDAPLPQPVDADGYPTA